MLTTVMQVKTVLTGIGEAVPESHDSLIDFFIKRISGSVERFCRRKFGTQTYTAELHTGLEGDKELFFDQWPVTSITTVTLDGVAVIAGVAAENYQQIKNVDGDVTALYRKNGWKSEPYGVSLTYIAGYILPALNVTTNTLPYDVEGAVVELVAGTYLNRGKAGVSRESFEGLSVDMDRWPLHIKQALQKHQRPIV